MKRIIVIEDEAALLKNIVDMLELSGFEVASADDGETGLELVQQSPPDLIICDITMPGMDGYEVLMKIRDNPATVTTPFIFLTARADRPFMRHGMELGADDYLTKPFTLSELLSAIDTRLNRHQSIVDASTKDLHQAKRALIQLVSHELRTPLVSVTAVTDIISRQISNLSAGQLQELLDTLDRGTQRLTRLVEQIVLIVQIETGALSPNSLQEYAQTFQFSDLLIAAVDLARRFAYRQPDVSIRLDERDHGAVVQGDMRALRHAFAELISNALSFSPLHGEVNISLWQADQIIWISIVDKGPGIPPERLAQALEAFHQIDRETNEQQGIGLGLPLSKQIIEIHGGTFEINSVVERGTQITIGLPTLEA
jgi:two-component system sensor histidine kinase/response regulator